MAGSVTAMPQPHGTLGVSHTLWMAKQKARRNQGVVCPFTDLLNFIQLLIK